MRLFLLLTLFAIPAYAGDNHVHIEQATTAGGDNLQLNIDQYGYGNLIQFSLDHNNNTFNLQQKGNNNTISWVPWWGSGKGWGGDVDGTNNTIDILQEGDGTYGAHVWGNYNDVNIYQDGSGEHETYLDIHADSTVTDVWQEGSGNKYSTVYYYGSTDSAEVDLLQKGTGAHTATVTLQGDYATTLQLLQQGPTAQSYSITNTCLNPAGCSVSVTQGQ